MPASTTGATKSTNTADTSASTGLRACFTIQDTPHCRPEIYVLNEGDSVDRRPLRLCSIETGPHPITTDLFFIDRKDLPRLSAKSASGVTIRPPSY